MAANHSKSVLVYRQLRRALQAGRYVPGERVDPAALAAEFHISPTPVRFALYRLVGEGLLVDRAREGLYVPLLTELAMHDLYDWMQRLLLMALDIGTPAPRRTAVELRPRSASDDLVKLTWKLFDTIAGATGHRSLHRAVRQANDRLAPIRRAKQGLLESTFDELAQLHIRWQQRDIPALAAELRGYHERRKRLVPEIVALLNERSERFH
ncbi:GntR family transcriptional regulator [Coralloluteibacterium stylophorae]|uniref:GntR family transcriptional regulator n=1 Tax=Coralloluteibacterium stylophorae TaxID=1776034 RepID=A0A8J7VTB3_9GAMM|nr:GntR family transcriptional regulator [Coralloluteibacterium stylophorae]MBS7456840.1 GntR family transcriptional regulator [Coralloluteibacterium stylophorae]